MRQFFAQAIGAILIFVPDIFRWRIFTPNIFARGISPPQIAVPHIFVPGRLIET
jgi:hypothetical protein